MSNRITYNSWQKDTVYEKYGGCCAICGSLVRKNKMTINHKIPLSMGGTNEIKNLQLTCWSCNQAKSNLPMDKFLIKIWQVFRYNENEILALVDKNNTN